MSTQQVKCTANAMWSVYTAIFGGSVTVCGVFVDRPSAAAWCPVLHGGWWTEAWTGKDAMSLMSMWRDSLSTAPHTHWPACEETPSPQTPTHTDQQVKGHPLHSTACEETASPQSHTHTDQHVKRQPLRSPTHTLTSMWRDSLSTATGVLTNTTSVVHSLHVAFVYKLCIDYSDPHSMDRDIHWLFWPTSSGCDSPLISITDYSHPGDGTVYQFFWPTFRG